MFVVHLNINCNSVNYYFNIKRNARLFERKFNKDTKQNEIDLKKYISKIYLNKK